MYLTRANGERFEIVPTNSIEVDGELWGEKSPPLIEFLFEIQDEEELRRRWEDLLQRCAA